MEHKLKLRRLIKAIACVALFKLILLFLPEILFIFPGFLLLIIPLLYSIRALIWIFSDDDYVFTWKLLPYLVRERHPSYNDRGDDSPSFITSTVIIFFSSVVIVFSYLIIMASWPDNFIFSTYESFNLWWENFINFLV